MVDQPALAAPGLLVVVAHPDDETFACGSVLLHAAEQGATTAVCCATRGEAGEPAPGSGVTVDQLPHVRERELREAARLLGVSRVELLDYRDSGMSGDAAPGSLVAAPLGVVAAGVAAVIDDIRPHVIVTLDASDGHRDHAHMRDATIEAVTRATWPVQRVYLHCLPRSLLQRWAAHMRLLSPESPYVDVDAAGLGTPDEQITTIIDTASHLEARRAAIARHASQASPFAALPAELADAFLAADHLRRVMPASEGDRRETGLLAALDLLGPPE